MRIRKDDTVMITSGKDRGKTGKVHRVLPKHDKVLVEGINLVKRHQRPRPNVRQSGIIEREAPLHISNVMLVCTKCGKPTRIGHRFLADGTKVRVCRRCGEVTDKG